MNVVFGGLPIEDGDEESLQYFPIDKVFCCSVFSNFLFVYFCVSEKSWSFYDSVLPDARIQAQERPGGMRV